MNAPAGTDGTQVSEYKKISETKIGLSGNLIIAREPVHVAPPPTASPVSSAVTERTDARPMQACSPAPDRRFGS